VTWTDFLSLFLPLFVAMDPLGILPAFIQMTSNLSVQRRQKVLNGSVLLAGIVGILFIPLGPRILLALGLKVGDFQIAGGLLVLVIALRDIVWEQKMFSVEDSNDDSMGIVPIGIPLLVGPAVLATLILLGNRFDFWEIAGSLLLNLLLTWIIFRNASYLMQFMGVTGSKVVSKLSALLLSAYAVMMIRVALASIINK
jgi:multiple antibiotic resistance protein